MRIRHFILAGLLTAAGCATPYQIDGNFGGQTPKWRSTHMLEIQARGNGYTSSTRLARMTLLRAAESAIEAHFRYFIEASSEDKGSESTIYMPESQTTTYTGSYTPNGYSATSTTSYSGGELPVYKPGANVVYRMYETLPPGARPGQFYDAYEIYNRLGPKYISGFTPRHPPQG